MAYTGNEGIYIPHAHAATKTKNHEAHGKRFPKDTKAHLFGRKKIEELLAQKGCIGIRVYHGINEDGSRSAMMVGVLADGNDIVTPKMGKDGDGSQIIESDIPCPTHCPPNASL